MSEGGATVRGLPARYQVVRRIGRGGSADVFLVDDSGGLPARKAVKVLRADSPADLLETLRNEFRILASLDHPGLARVHDFGALPDGRSYYTSDFVEGRELGADGPIPIAPACLAMAAVCRTLAYLAARGYTHNDVKPANILCGAAHEQARLLDLGLAGLERAGARVVSGTPGYIAPERLAGHPWDIRSDLYAVGATLYRVLSGRRLHEIEDPKKALAALHAGFAPLGELRPDAPASLCDLVDDLLRLDPTRRPRHPSEVVLRLGGAVGRSLPLETPGTSRCYALASTVWGRDSELARIEQALAVAATGAAARVIAVQGAAGSGKTRLLREVAIRAEMAGWTVVHDPVAVAETGRVLTIVDDADALGDAGWQNAIARVTAPKAKTAVLLAFAADGLAPEARQRLALAESTGNVARVSLGPLSAAVIGRMLDSLFGEGVIPAARGDDLARRAGGSPLLVEELVREMVETGAVRSTQAGWTAADAPTGRAAAAASPRLEDFLRRRSRDLPVSAAEALRVLAALGGRAAEDAIAVVAGDGIDVPLGLALLIERGLCLREGDETTLAHGSLRSIALDGGDAVADRGLHRRALAWLSAHGAGDEALAAAHRGAGDAAPAFACAVRAGQAARAAGEGRRAAALLEQALKDAEEAGVGSGDRVAALRACADALRMCGRHADALNVLARCFDLLPADASRDRARVASEVARAALFSNDLDAAASWLQRGEESLDPADALGAILLRRVRANLAWHRGRCSLALAEMEAVLASLAGLRDPEAESLRVPALCVLCAYAQPFDLARSRALGEEAVALAQGKGSAFLAAYAANNLADTLLRCGEPAAAAAVTERALADSEQAGSVGLAAGLLTNLADAEHQRGAFETARRRLAAAMPVAAADGVAGEVGLRGYAALFAWREGDAATAERQATATLATSARAELAVPLLAIAAWSAAERGDRDAADAFAARAAAEARWSGAPAHLALAQAAAAYAVAAEDAAAGGARLAEIAEALAGLGRNEAAPLVLRDAARFLARGGDVERARAVRDRVRKAVAAVTSGKDADPGSVERVLGEESGASAARDRRAAARPGSASAPEITFADSAPRRLDAAASRAVELTVGRVILRHEFAEVVGRGAAIRGALAMLDRLADGETPVLLLGETGTGKEVFARALHAAGPRAAGPFVAVNCAALPAPLFEAELFGHRRGAFTGATTDHDGFAQEASGGTLLLDEIGDLPLELQPKLLRMLDERRVRPVGAARPVPIDVRIVAATNRDLSAEVEAGRFRRDLYFRLAVVEIALPPLRERADDLPELARHVLGKRGYAGRAIDPAAMRALRAHGWPGNVRELENELVRAAVLAGGGPIRRAHLSARVVGSRPDARATAPTLADRMQDFERRVVEEVLVEVGGNRTRAARVLGITRQSLLPKLHKLGLARPPTGRERTRRARTRR